jgi:hypothetical protein
MAATKTTQNDLYPGEDADISKEIHAVVPSPDAWIYMPNDQLGGERPRDFIGTPREHVLRGLVRAIKDGVPT